MLPQIPVLIGTFPPEDRGLVSPHINDIKSGLLAQFLVKHLTNWASVATQHGLGILRKEVTVLF